MQTIIAILDDDLDRTEAMRGQLDKLFSSWSHIFFNNAPDMIEWLKYHLQDCILISLDHDLGPNHQRNHQVFDPGIGRDVVNYLATQSPQCPIIIHTSNSLARIGMEMTLFESGWLFTSVFPCYHLDWIYQEWTDTVKTLLKSTSEQALTLQTIPHSQPPQVVTLEPDSQLEVGASKKFIVLLDNCEQRLEKMRDHLDLHFPQFTPKFFKDAPKLIDWLETHLQNCVLISLDHNLGASITRNGKTFDPGTGRDVVNYLTCKLPQCPVIIHTSRSEAAIGMEITLAEGNWLFERAVHTNDLEWIDTVWITIVKRLLEPIANADLSDKNLPIPAAKWEEICHFALSFDPNLYWDNFENCAEFSKQAAQIYHKEGKLPHSLTGLRTCLWYERWRWRRYNLEPDDEVMGYIQAVLAKIRQLVMGDL